MEMEYIFTKSENEKIKVEGATVLEAIPNRYKSPLIVFDYEALYPNSIITYNLSTDTLVDDDDEIL